MPACNAKAACLTTVDHVHLVVREVQPPVQRISPRLCECNGYKGVITTAEQEHWQDLEQQNWAHLAGRRER